MPIIPTLSIIAGIFLISYVAMMAFVMTYGAMQMQFAQSVRDTGAHVGVLESQYLALVTKINHTNPATLDLTKPTSIAYIIDTSQPTVSIRMR